MTNIRILDCTLRDGGYVNNFAFGHDTIAGIIDKLTDARTDIIECGFLEDVEYNPDSTLFNHVSQINQFLPSEPNKSMYVAMICFGEYNIDNLPPYSGKGISGIRVTYHLHEMEDALKFCQRIIDKGYHTFAQPVGTMMYTDEQLLQMIKLVNELKPYAFYIVDTLGTMRAKNIKHLFYLVDNNLSKDIRIGFHSHNNLQLSFSNSQELTKIQTGRTIILDSSIYGMGRGAGNLNTELITSHINDKNPSRYNTNSYLEIIDEYFGILIKNFKWGYAIPYYLAAQNNCHPNYASFLMDRKTLTVRQISEILKMIPSDKSELYNKATIEDLYFKYNAHYVDDAGTILELKKEFQGKSVVVMAPGSSLKQRKDKISEHICKNNSIVLSINFVPSIFQYDYVFWGNSKRFELGKCTNKVLGNSIVTSNIANSKAKYILNYSSLSIFHGLAKDNSTLMALELLSKLDVKEITIAGFDGYNASGTNYDTNNLQNDYSSEMISELNEQISQDLRTLASRIKFTFLTPSLYVK